jgi:peptidoglycan/xylan/chitin deacetylase (PgdA/CDA1 family)
MKAQIQQLARKAWRQQLRARASVQRHGLVLMYHRVAEPSSDPWDMAVSPAHFAEHLDVLRHYGDCLPLAAFADRMGSSDRPRRMIAITFDDGYRDNLLNAAPLLEARDMPATVFVVSSTVGAGRDFWWDALARVFLTMPHLPAELRLQAAGQDHVWLLGDAADCTADDLRALRRWSADNDGVWHPRQTLFLEVWKILNGCRLDAAEALCEQVLAWAGAERAGPATDHSMSAEEVERLASGGLIEIGGHTVNHFPLDVADPIQAAAEIGGCRTALRDMAGREIDSFSYPFGRFGKKTPEIVRQAGFKRACNSWNWRLLAYPETDRFRIPRITIPNMDGDQFTAFLQGLAGK